MTKRSFNEGFGLACRQGADGFEISLGRHPLVTLVVVADAVLQLVTLGRQPGGDVVDIRCFREAAFHADCFADCVEVRCGLAPGKPNVAPHIVAEIHGSWSC